MVERFDKVYSSMLTEAFLRDLVGYLGWEHSHFSILLVLVNLPFSISLSLTNENDFVTAVGAPAKLRSTFSIKWKSDWLWKTWLMRNRFGSLFCESASLLRRYVKLIFSTRVRHCYLRNFYFLCLFFNFTFNIFSLPLSTSPSLSFILFVLPFDSTLFPMTFCILINF